MINWRDVRSMSDLRLFSAEYEGLPLVAKVEIQEQMQTDLAIYAIDEILDPYIKAPDKPAFIKVRKKRARRYNRPR